MRQKLLSILALLCITASSAWAASPTGELRSLDSKNGSIYISGWAYDPDAESTSIEVHFYIYTQSGNPGGSGSYVKSVALTANGANSHGWYSVSGNHEFSGYVDVSNVTPGSYYICVFGIDTSGSGNQRIPGVGSAAGITEFHPTVYAPYTVTLNSESGTGGSTSVSNVRTGFDMPSATMPTRAGYTFGGYFDQENGNGTKYYNADGSSAKAWDKHEASNSATATLYAQWTAIASYNVTANSASEAYWATFYSNAGNYQAAEGTQVFTVSLAGTGITMHEVSDRIAKSGQGVVLKKTTTGNFTMTLTETAPAGDFSGNSLTGTMTVINTTGANDYYVLGGKSGAGFYKLSNTSGTIGANKAYLTYSGGGAAAARGFFLFDETTGIEMPTAEDGNADAVVFDLQGRRVLNPTNGLYIVNGKKVFINK